MAGDPTSELWRAVASEPHPDPASALARTATRLGHLEADRAAPVQDLMALLEDKDWPTPPSVAPRIVRALEHLCDALDRGATGEAFELTDLLGGELRPEIAGHRSFREVRSRLEGKPRLDNDDFENGLIEARRAARAQIQEQRYLAGRGWWIRFKERLGIA